MSPGVIQVRADICSDCPTPCAWQRDARAHAEPCAACPIGRWGEWGDCSQLPGDKLAALIERRVLTPIEQAIPAAAQVVASVRRCGGCTQAKHQLGSNDRHPDATAPIV